MGIYVYSIKKTSRRNVEFDGQKVEAAALTFHYKPFFDDRYDRPYEMALGRLDRAWANQTPDFVVMGEWKEGATVQSGWPKGKVAWNDNCELPGQTLGFLTRQGRGWKIVKVG